MHHIARTLLHLLAGLCLTMQLFAQAPSFNASSVWHEELWRYEGLQAHHIVYTITVTGDTMIGGSLYQKLHQAGVNTINELLGQPTPPPVVVPFANYAGALRADADAAQWWLVQPGNTEADLLYDFNLEVGGTVTGTFGDCGTGPVCTAIDAVWFNGQMHRRFILDNGFRHLIEGVGASSGLLGHLCQFFEEFSCLQVYEQDHAGWEVEGCAAVATGVPQQGAEQDTPPAFPNPTTGGCTLGRNFANVMVQVQDAAGRIVAVHIADATGRVDLGALAPGGYLIVAQGQRFRVVRQ